MNSQHAFDLRDKAAFAFQCCWLGYSTRARCKRFYLDGEARPQRRPVLASDVYFDSEDALNPDGPTSGDMPDTAEVAVQTAPLLVPLDALYQSNGVLFRPYLVPRTPDEEPAASAP